MKYHFPQQGVEIEAKSYEEACNKLNKKNKVNTEENEVKLEKAVIKTKKSSTK